MLSRPRLLMLTVPVALAFTALLFAQGRVKDRIYVDQYGALRSELMIADANGKNPRKFIPGVDIDYNPSFSPDGQWVVFTSERKGSADIYRVRVDGMGLERLTDSPAFEDQGAMSPDGKSLAFVSSRDKGSVDIYILDIASKKVRNLTNAPGGDFRPSWSPDGKVIAFTSDRGTGFVHNAGSWEHIHTTNLYVINADGTGLRKIAMDPQMSVGSPKWSSDGKSLVFYELPAKDTFIVRGGDAGRITSQIVTVDVATGARKAETTGPGVKVSPQFLGPDRIAYHTRAGTNSLLSFTSGEKSAPGDISHPAWSPDGKSVIYVAGIHATMHSYLSVPGRKLNGIDPNFELVYGSGFPTASPDGKMVAVSERVPAGEPGSSATGDRSSLVVWDASGANPRRIYHDERTVMGLQWSHDGNWIAYGAGGFFAARVRQPGRIMIIKPDGTGTHIVTEEAGNAGFPSWSPDGKQIVYRYWTSEGPGGLRIVDVATSKTRTLTDKYDTIPTWSPKGDQIVFMRYEKDARWESLEFDIWSIHPDGTGLKRLTDSEGNDAHPYFTPDGRILWSSSRFGYKDEASLTTQPQPYAELFIMNADGSNQRPLTDNQYEDGTPSLVPAAVMEKLLKK